VHPDPRLLACTRTFVPISRLSISLGVHTGICSCTLDKHCVPKPRTLDLLAYQRSLLRRQRERVYRRPEHAARDASPACVDLQDLRGLCEERTNVRVSCVNYILAALLAETATRSS